ncbi:MAG TPA: type IV secretion protein IcmL [Legionella sp.]|nr:type IV secretion protein IcmL [Legionella sp.]
MGYFRTAWLFFLWATSSLQAFATVNDQDIQRAVWVNEAIIATFTYSHQDFLARQKDIAKYFTADGWIAYSKALQESKLQETVKNNTYYVSAVATMPPTVKPLANKKWQAIMPVLVLYKNPEYKQEQTLSIRLSFIEAPAGTGVRGFAVTDLQASVEKHPCQCVGESSARALA